MGKSMVGVAVAMTLAGAVGCSSHLPGASDGTGGTSGTGGATLAGNGGNGGSGPAGVGGGVTEMPVGGTTGAGQSPVGCLLPTAPAGTWVEIAPPPSQSGFFASDAFAVGQDDLLFAGSTYDPTTSGPAPTDARVLRWTHGCWTLEVSLPASVTPPYHPSVHGTGPNDLWAAASDVLYHRDAQGWTRFTDETWRNIVRQPPSFLQANIEVNRVRAAAPGDLWIAATSNILHWSGGAWTSYNFDDPTYPTTSASIGFFFSDIWIDSPSSVWVAGGSDQVGNTMDLGFVHHFDGAAWTHHNAAVGEVEAIWRGGSVLWLAQPSEDGLTVRSFDGTTATGVPIAGVDPHHGAVYVSSLFGRGANDVWAAGEDVAHFDGQAWSLVSDAPGAARSTIGLETNTLVTGDAAATWLVTPGPHFFRKVTSP
jgi:hypothetical protein